MIAAENAALVMMALITLIAVYTITEGFVHNAAGLAAIGCAVIIIIAVLARMFPPKKE